MAVAAHADLFDVSIVIPMRNPEHSLDRMLPSLCSQVSRLSSEVIVVDNGIGPAAEESIRRSIPGVCILTQPEPGLAVSYNAGIAGARGRVIVLMHQDVVLPGADELERIVAPLNDPEVVAAYPSLYLSPETYAKYDFWHRVMFCTMANRCGKRIPTFSGKFDAVRRSILLRIGGFDAVAYRTAGEDVDMRIRLTEVGRVVKTDVVVEHIHGWNRKASLQTLIGLERRWGETSGVVLRRHGMRFIRRPGRHLGDLSQLLKPAAVASLLAGFAHPALAAPGIAAACLYRLPAVRFLPWFALLTPFLNAMLFVCFSLGFVGGFIRGKQRM
jgi:glycosyltransferase involved in cell wall biosynthesis